ncbi:TetR/AcrR family transcriptional regulator [Chloroflexota bacterium]
MTEQNTPKEPGTREYILSVASRLFSERGFASVSIRDICEPAGVTPPTIYYYFGNKDRLFQLVISRTLSLKDFRETLVAAVEKQSDPRAKLSAYIQHYLDSFPRGFFNPGMFLQTSTQLYGKSTEQVLNEFQAINKMTRSIIQEGVQTGAFRKVDIDMATEYLGTLLMAFVLVEVHYYQLRDPHELTPFITDLFLNGLNNLVTPQ